MSDRGKRLATFAWLGATAVLIVVVVLTNPRPVPVLSSGLNGPTGSATPTSTGVLAALPSIGVITPYASTAPTPGATLVVTSSPSATASVSSAPTTASPTATPTPTANPTAAPTQPPAPTPTPGPPPSLSSCPIFPASNVWNRRVDGLPVAANSDAMVAAIGGGAGLHPDFSDGGWYGIPFNVVGSGTPRSTVTFQYAEESDHVGYPIPADPAIEGGSDRHILMVETNECSLYELFAADGSGGAWSAGSGATWDLSSNALRPETWTSADAAGLPIFPGLVRYQEVAAGEIRHAIRFTAPQTCNGYIYPARHEAGSGSCSVNPPMGLRVRLKAGVDISGFGPQSRIVLVALQRYGMLLADNGSAWYITGAPHNGWDDDGLHDLGRITGADFEVVDTSGFVNG